jgi:hypothetical protein
VNYKLEWMWKEAVLAQFKVLLRHLPGGTEENHKKPSQDNTQLVSHVHIKISYRLNGKICTAYSNFK